MLDELDRKILFEFCKLKENEFTTTLNIAKSSWEIMKRIYKDKKSPSENFFNTKIKRRIERMAKEGLFSVEGNPKSYVLDSNRVFIKKFDTTEGKKKGLCVVYF